jgi:predicted Fe-Mo cluster-binding NifX family protein
MRIAVSAEENRGLESAVSHHFGRCLYFIIVDIEDDAIKDVQAVENPYYSNHQPGMVPEFISSQKVDVMISGGMGRKAIGFFQQFGITPATGAFDNVQATIDRYLDGGMNEAAPCRESVKHSHDDHGKH